MDIKSRIAAIDLGGTNTRLAIFDSLAEIQSLETFNTPQKPQELIEELYKRIARDPAISSISVGAAGFWDKDCVLRQSINLPQYIGFPIWEDLSKKLQLPVYLKSDVELAALGEAVYGQANLVSNLLYINLGTGFAAGLYKDGQIFSTKYSPTLRLDFLIHPTQAIHEGKLLRDIEFQASDLLSTTVVNLALILSPQKIVIGGGKVKDKWDSLIKPSMDNSLNYLKQVLVYDISIEKAKLDLPTLYGAYEIARK